MDTQTADYFTKIFNSVRLLGAQCLLTGIRPAVAQTLVHIGVQLDQVTTRRNLQQGLQECLRVIDRDRAARAQHARAE
jgi:rsbT co-antagonist protein RsbR